MATPLPQTVMAVLEVSGVYLMMHMDDVVALLPRLATARVVDRDWGNDSFKLAPKGRRALSVTPLTDGELASIIMRSDNAA